MKQCWAEGDLRAYADGELPRETQEQIGRHLEICAACNARHGELSTRAARVSQLIAMLPEMATTGAVRVAPMRAHHSRPLTVVALSLAAALAIGFIVLPKRGKLVAPVAKAPVVVAPAPAEKPVVSARGARPLPVRRRAARPKAPPDADYFLRLDDEPIETGTVVRVGAENGDVQAELILGPDGRAHAIRLIREEN